MKWVVFLGLVLSSSAFVKRDVGTNLFSPGKEYVYALDLHVNAGSDEYVSFASSFNITGEIHIQNTGNDLNVKLNDIKFGAYNGKYDYFNHPVFEKKPYEQLTPLSEPFTVQIQNGKAKGIVLNNNVAEWAHNIKRGIATALQLDLNKIHVSKGENFESQEETVVGTCKTDYSVVPGEDDKHLEVRKYRSHSECTDIPHRIRKPGVSIQYCPDDNTRDVLNSSSFTFYHLEVQGGKILANAIVAGSSTLYNIFGTAGHTQYSYTGLYMVLKEVKDGGSVAGPSNAKNFDDLRFVFENDLEEDEDLKSPKPFFFHHKDADLDSAGQNKAADQLVANIKKVHQSLESVEVFADTKEFHKNSPFSLIPFVSALDYQHLTDVHNKMKGGDETEYKLFLDSLVISGTGPAALAIRDIASNTQDTLIIGRIIGPLANYVRNPTENLLKELESLIKPDNTKTNGRVIEFSFASLLGRTCKNSGCQKSGLLDKWVKIWSDKIDSSSNFDEKTSAVLALRNVNTLAGAEKLLTIVTDKKQERSIRSAALFGLMPLLKKDPHAMKANLLPIYNDRTEDAELRNNAVQMVLWTANEQNVFREVAIGTYIEKNPDVKNFVRTLLTSMAGTTRPCLDKRGSWAKTAIAMMVHFQSKAKYSGSYITDYHDREYNFGHMTFVSVQKTGESLLPRTAYIGFNGQTAGYATNYLGLFVRMEGVGKALSSRIMSMTTGVIDFDEIKEIFTKIGVQERQPTPLRIEIAIMLHNRVVAYHAADQKTVTTIPQLIKKLGEYKSAAYDKEMVRMMLIGGVTTEQPNEMGIPVSTLSAVTSVIAIHAKVSSGKAGTTVSRNYDVRMQMNLHGISVVSNHLTPFGTAHSVEAVRSMRIRVPRKISIGLDMKQQSINFVLSTPTQEDPIKAQIHATAFTAVQSDAPAALKDKDVVDLLHQTCPECKGIAIISKGEKYREERQLGSGYKYKALEGISAGAKYYDCEKIHSRIHVLKQLRKFFGPENKNLGGRLGRPLTLLRLGARYMLQTLFLSPPTETCGMKVWYHQEPTAQSIFEKVEGQAKVKYESDIKEKIGTKVQIKSSLHLKYGGAVPKTKIVDMGINFAKIGFGKVDLKVKLAAKDESTQRSGVVCVDVTTSTNSVPDFFDYEGENEPTFERTVNIAWAKEDKTGKEGACPTNAAGIKITRKSHRSQAQKDEAKSDHWPYKQCRDVKNSDKFPGDLTPSTESCLWAAFKQTNLRESNITIEYKVDPEARKRWRYPGILAAAILIPYSVPSDSVDEHAAHGNHGATADGFIQGEIKMDVTMDEEHPEADIHFHSSQGEQEHFHGVDLNFLPGPLKRPVFSRFSPLQKTGLELGFTGYCLVTPHAIQTFDNSSYYADISECLTLISGDCTEKPRYIVLGKKIAGDNLGIKIIIGEHKIELSDLNFAIIDGKSVALSEQIHNPEGDSKIVKIFRVQNDVFVISSPLNLFIRYTGHYISTLVDSRFRGTQCGLCGNFDGCNGNDFTGPDSTCKNLAASDMTKAYVVRDGSCATVGSACPK